MREMKDSGVEWIGSIPESWQIHTIGSLFKVRNEKVNDTDYPPLSVSKGGIVPQMENVAKTDARDNRKKVQQNDFVINSRSDRKQSCGLSSLTGSVSLINIVMYVTENALLAPEYVNYLLKNYGFAEEFYRWGHGIVADLWTTRWQEMKSILLPVPSEEEQVAIAQTIDNKLTKVDALIANVQAQIEKLKAYKQSLITEVVTKGLDPTVPMKDSGVEWIGEIPDGWGVRRIKDICYLRTGRTPSTTCPHYFNGELPWFTPGDFSESFTIDCSVRTLTAQAEKDGVAVILPPYTPLVVGIGASAGKVALSRVKCSCNQQITALVCKEIYPLFLMYALVAGGANLRDTAAYTTLPIINNQTLGLFKIVIPSQTEQIEIVSCLDAKCAKIDTLIGIKQEKITKLEQYKRSLIYEYVTGKKEVK